MDQSFTELNPNDLPTESGHFGIYGGMYVPETLMTPLYELNQAYQDAKKDPDFNQTLKAYLKEFAGRPTSLYFAERLAGFCEGA